MPDHDILVADQRPITLTTSPIHIRFYVTDIKFPDDDIEYIHNATQLKRVNSCIINGVDAFDTAAAIYQKTALDITSMDMMVFSSPHGVLADGSDNRHMLALNKLNPDVVAC